MLAGYRRTPPRDRAGRAGAAPAEDRRAARSGRRSTTRPRRSRRRRRHHHHVESTKLRPRVTLGGLRRRRPQAGATGRHAAAHGPDPAERGVDSTAEAQDRASSVPPGSTRARSSGTKSPRGAGTDARVAAQRDPVSHDKRHDHALARTPGVPSGARAFSGLQAGPHLCPEGGMIASSDSIEGATETNSRIRLINGGESPPRKQPVHV